MDQKKSSWLWISLGVLGFSVLLTITVFTTSPGIPSYKGRSAESWLQGVFATGATGTTQREAIDAFKEMGTNGINFLVESLDYHDSPSRKISVFIHSRLPASLRAKIQTPLDENSRFIIAALVLMNVRDPKPEATFPKLVQMLDAVQNDKRHYICGLISHYPMNYPRVNYSRYRADLIRALKSSDGWNSIYLATALKHANLKGPELISALQSALTNSNPSIRKAAQQTLDSLTEKNGRLLPAEPSK